MVEDRKIQKCDQENRDKKERGGYQKEKKNESVCRKVRNLKFI